MQGIFEITKACMADLIIVILPDTFTIHLLPSRYTHSWGCDYNMLREREREENGGEKGEERQG